jgi:hypothetical protein
MNEWTLSDFWQVFRSELNYDPHPEFCCNILLETKIVQMQGQRENQCQAHHVKQSMS